jgi:hypothetical protein
VARHRIHAAHPVGKLENLLEIVLGIGAKGKRGRKARQVNAVDQDQPVRQVDQDQRAPGGRLTILISGRSRRRVTMPVAKLTRCWFPQSAKMEAVSQYFRMVE